MKSFSLIRNALTMLWTIVRAVLVIMILALALLCKVLLTAYLYKAVIV